MKLLFPRRPPLHVALRAATYLRAGLEPVGKVLPVVPLETMRQAGQHLSLDDRRLQLGQLQRVGQVVLRDIVLKERNIELKYNDMILITQVAAFLHKLRGRKTIVR